MGFNPDEDVEPMAYNFTKFGGQEADIPEPTDSLILEFWKGWLQFLQLGKSDRETIAKVLNEGTPDGMTEGSAGFKAWQDQRDSRIQELVAGVSERGMKAIETRKDMIAKLCQNQPSVDELNMLPSRVYAAFEAYVMGKMAPEGLTTALNL